MSNFQSVIPWHVLKAHLENELSKVDKQLRHANDPSASELRGRAQLLEELLNLPETMSILGEQDEQDRKEEAAKQARVSK